MAFPYDQTQAENLIDGLLAPNAVTHPGLLDAVRRTPREAFVPPLFARSAYADEEIPLNAGRYLMEPLVQLKLLQAMDVQFNESIMIVGGATGYTAALLSGLCARITLVEEEGALAAHAQDTLSSLGLTNIAVVHHALTQGSGGNAPYDAILIEGSVQMIPHSISGQLKDGGRLLAVENKQLRPGTSSGLGEALYYEKNGKNLSARSLFDAGVSLLPGFAAPTGFRFN